MAISRPEEIKLGDTSLYAPVYFPSISTVKTALAPAEYLATLHSLRDINQQFLVSAFDLNQPDNTDDLARCSGQVIPDTSLSTLLEFNRCQVAQRRMQPK
jgi:hypothetical protein